MKLTHSERDVRGRLVLLARGGGWPSAAISYRSIRIHDAVIAQFGHETDEDFAIRVTRVAQELNGLGLTLGQVLISLPSGNERAAILSVTGNRGTSLSAEVIPVVARVLARGYQRPAALERAIAEGLQSLGARVRAVSSEGERVRRAPLSLASRELRP
jgi:hypothetical protein